MNYTAKISWQKASAEIFTDNRYHRAHQWTFDGGIEVTASSSPHVVPVPMSNEHAVDPEEALVASVSSCHMLWFLSIAAGKKYIVTSYEDNATGFMGKNADGKIAFTKIVLSPKITFGGDHPPAKDQIDILHQMAHENCYIASSLKTEIEIAIV